MKFSYEETYKQIEGKRIGNLNALVGFDAVIDNLVHVVKNRNENGVETLFSTIGEFGEYLCTKDGMSCGIELKKITSKIGGNMAILSQAMSVQGVDVSCIGTLGEEGSFLHQTLAKNCKVYSVAPFGKCTALEFKNGKVMLAELEDMQIQWSDVINRVGEKTLLELLTNCQILCLVNWSELIHSSEIWRELLSFAVKHQVTGEKVVFFDLADCSPRSKADVLECMSLIKDYSGYFKTVLGLNKNEAYTLSKVLGIEADSIEGIGPALQKATEVETLIIHTKHSAHAFDADGSIYHSQSFVCENPITLTGCGDNFNAGYCLGILLELNIKASLLLGHGSSGYYVRNGVSADFDSLKKFIKDALEGGCDEAVDGTRL